jgi:hypothetical protein
LTFSSLLNSNLANKANMSDLPNKGPYTGDLNNISGNANILIFHRASNNCLNAPTAAYGLVETLYIDSTLYAIQRFTSFETVTRFFVRKKDNGAWSSWAEK